MDDLVKYEVMTKCFVNDTRYEPRPDGKPVYVMARPGLTKASLRLVDPSPAVTGSAPKAKEPAR